MNDARLNELRQKYKDRNLLEELGWGAYANHSGYTSKSNGEFLNWLCNEAYRELKKTQPEPCDDVVSRKAAIRACGGYLVPAGIIKALPPVTPKQRAEKWILVTDNNGQHFVCNKCGEWRYHQRQKFCGECGSKMKGENNG